MALITRYLREGLLYSKDELRNLLQFENEEDLLKFISIMKKYRIVKMKRFDSYQEDASILDDDDTDYIDLNQTSDGVKYLFRYVGVVYSNERVLKIYPKYISDSKEPKNEMDLVISVLKKYKDSKREYINYFSDDNGNRNYNHLSVIFYILEDFVNNGLLLKNEEIIDLNGDGEILWQKTIDENIPYISKGLPFYSDVYTREQTIDNKEFFKQLHEIVVSMCSRELEQAELTEMFNMPVIYLSNKSLEDLGDFEYILDRIDIELTQQFDDRKRSVLKALKSYISKSGKIALSEESALLFGTRAFHEVWEDVINVVFDNQSKLTLGEIKNKYVETLDYSITLPNGSGEVATSDMRLESIIEKPEWHISRGQLAIYSKYLAKKTFIPDYLKLSKNGESFYILDAKYYVPNVYETPDGQFVIEKQPGVEDITKQYMYYLVYCNLLERNNIDIKGVNNYFIMPSEDEDMDIGYAKLDIFGKIVPNIFDIRIKKLNAYKLYEHYINDETLGVELIP